MTSTVSTSLPSASSLALGSYVHRQIVSFIAKLLRPVKVPDDLSRDVAELSHTVLITQSHSLVIQGLLLSFAQRLGFSGLRRLQPQDLAEMLQAPDSSVPPLSWASMHDLSRVRWPEPSKLAGDGKLQLRTVNVFQVRGPIRKWPSFKPSPFWIWGLIPTRRILSVSVGERIPLLQQSSQRLLRKIKIDFVRTLKLVRGTPFEPREEQAAAILSGPEFEREIQILSDRSGISLGRGKRAAERAFYELAAAPRRFMYDALSWVAHALVSRLFSSINTHGLDRLMPAIKEHTVILVPMHRSHLDYVLVGYKLFSEKVNPPLVAAGINLAFWPFGFLFRSVGAYFVKRNARDRFHTVVLRRYVAYLVARGHLQEFFIEGGRSRSGKMLAPKLGLLSVIADAWKPERPRDILFVPVSITYENLVEDESFAQENAGGSKVRESIVSTLRAFSVFRRRYGEVAIQFGEPISLKQFKARPASDGNGRTGEKTEVQRLGFELCRSIREQSNPGLSSLCYTALLMAPRYGLDQAGLMRAISGLHAYLELLRSSGVRIGRDTTQLQRFSSGDEEILDDVLNAGIVRCERHFGTDYFYIPGQKRFAADYYRNATLHFFFPLALLSLSELSFKTINPSTISGIYPFFEHDLLLENWNEFSSKIEKLCALLTARNILRPQGSDFRFSDPNGSFFLPALLASQLQAYQWVEESVLAAHEFFDDPIRYEDFAKRLLSGSKTATYRGSISRTEAATRTNINAVLSSLDARGLIKLSEGNANERVIQLDAAQVDAINIDLGTLKSVNGPLKRWILDKTN